MKFAVIIPARMDSKRLPGKPLVKLAGKAMIQRVWERCIEAIHHDHVYIATDSQRIFNSCQAFTANEIMTSIDDTVINHCGF